MGRLFESGRLLDHLQCSQVAQAHYMNADVTFACERCCVTYGYLQRLVWDVNGFSIKERKNVVFK